MRVHSWFAFKICSYLELDLIHPDSVEWLAINCLKQV